MPGLFCLRWSVRWRENAFQQNYRTFTDIFLVFMKIRNICDGNICKYIAIMITISEQVNGISMLIYREDFQWAMY